MTESVATEAKGELADDADGELAALLVGEQVVVRVLARGGTGRVPRQDFGPFSL